MRAVHHGSAEFVLGHRAEAGCAAEPGLDLESGSDGAVVAFGSVFSTLLETDCVIFLVLTRTLT